MLGGEKLIDGGLGFKLSDNSCQCGSVVVKLGFLHAALSAFVIEKPEYSVERLLGIIHHVGECPALTVLKKMVTGDGYLGHFGLQCVGSPLFWHSYTATTTSAPTNIVGTTTGIARGIPAAACQRVTSGLPPGLPEGTQRLSGN
jgi:hypothetical protein